MKNKKADIIGLIIFLIVVSISIYVMYKNEYKAYEEKLKYDLNYQGNLQFEFSAKLKSMLVYSKGQTIIQSTKDKIIRCFDSKNSKLDMDTNGIEYYIALDENRNITDFIAKNDKFQLVISADNIKSEDIGTIDSNAKYKITLLDKTLKVPVCDN